MVQKTQRCALRLHNPNVLLTLGPQLTVTVTQMRHMVAHIIYQLVQDILILRTTSIVVTLGGGVVLSKSTRLTKIVLPVLPVPFEQRGIY